MVAFQAATSRLFTRRGLLLAPFPTAMGGADLGTTPSTSETLMEVLVSIGRGSLPLGRLYEGHVNAIKLVALYGNRETLDLMREEAAAGRPSGVWMAEDGAPLRLTRTRDGLVLQGRKILASGSGHFRRPLVAALGEEGSVMVIPWIVDLARADTSGWTTQGMRATETGSVDFTGIEVTPAEIVGQPGDYMRSPFFRGGAWRVIAVQLGGLEGMMALYKAQVMAGRKRVRSASARPIRRSAHRHADRSIVGDRRLPTCRDGMRRSCGDRRLRRSRP